MDEVRTCISKHLPQGVKDAGITLDGRVAASDFFVDSTMSQMFFACIYRFLSCTGYLYLNMMFIHRGRQEATWTVLRKFGYDDDLELSDSYRSLA